MSNRRILSIPGLAIVGILFFSVPQGWAQVTLIKENFEEAVTGGRLVARGDMVQAGIRPADGRVHAFAGDEAEIVKGWDGNAFQFQDKIKDASLRLVFGTENVDLITSGTLEVSLDFRIEGQEGAIYSGNPLQVALSAPKQGYFLQTVISRRTSRIHHTNRNTSPAHEGMPGGKVVAPDTIYQLKLTVSLDKSTYDIKVTEKESGNVAWHASEQLFIPISDLKNNGLGASLLHLQAGTPDFSQEIDPPVTVSVDNILVRHLP